MFRHSLSTNGFSREHRLIFRQNEQQKAHAEQAETANSLETVDTYEELKERKEILVQKMDALAEDTTGAHKTNWVQYKKGFLEQFTKHEEDYCRSCTQETFSVLKNVLTDYQNRIDTFAKNPEYTTGPARSINKIGYRTWVIRVPAEESVGLTFGKNKEYFVSPKKIGELKSWGDLQKNGFTVTPDPEDAGRMIIRSDVDFIHRINNQQASQQMDPEKPVKAYDTGGTMPEKEASLSEGDAEALKKYLEGIAKIRQWIDTYGPQVLAGNADGTLQSDYWEAVPDEISMIKAGKVVWSKDKKQSEFEEKRQQFLEKQLSDRQAAVKVSRQKSAERKEVSKARDAQLVTAMNRDFELMIDLSEDTIVAESIQQELHAFPKTQYLSDKARAVGEKLLKMQDLHEWIKREEPRGWSNGEGMDWTFKSERETTSYSSDDLTNSIGARVRLALKNGSISEKDLEEYMTKVLKWTQKKKQTFRKALEEKLPDAEERKGQAPLVKPAKPREVKPVVTQKRDPLKALNAAGKKVLESPFIGLDAREIADNAMSTNTVAPEFEASLDAIAERVDIVQAFQTLLDPDQPFTNGEFNWRTDPNRVKERMFDKHIRRAVLAGRINRQNAAEYLQKEFGIPEKDIPKAISALEKRIGLTIRDAQPDVPEAGDASSSFNSRAKSRVANDLMPAERANILATLKRPREYNVLWTPLFTDEERKTVSETVKQIDEKNQDIFLFTDTVLSISEKMDKFQPLHEWVQRQGIQENSQTKTYEWKNQNELSTSRKAALERSRIALSAALDTGRLQWSDVDLYMQKVQDIESMPPTFRTAMYQKIGK